MVAAVCHFKEVQDAVNTAIQTLQCCILIAKLEFLDDCTIGVFNEFYQYDMTVADLDFKRGYQRMLKGPKK